MEKSGKTGWQESGGWRMVSPDTLSKECGLEDMGSYGKSLSHGGTKAKLALRRQMATGSGMQGGPKGGAGANGESDIAVYKWRKEEVTGPQPGQWRQQHGGQVQGLCHCQDARRL